MSLHLVQRLRSQTKRLIQLVRRKVDSFVVAETIDDHIAFRRILSATQALANLLRKLNRYGDVHHLRRRGEPSLHHSIRRR